MAYGGDDPAGWNVGDRMAEKGLSLKKKSTTDATFRGVNSLLLPGYEGGKGKDTLDAANPAFQQQMNQMFLLDTLAAHTDRHGGNFMVDKDKKGEISVRAIDNDLTFGALTD